MPDNEPVTSPARPHWLTSVLRALPAAALAILLVGIGMDLTALNRLDHPDHVANLISILDHREAVSLPYEWPESASGDPVVVVFGASSVRTPKKDSFDLALSSAMASRGAPVQIINHGFPGVDSTTLAVRIPEALAEGKRRGFEPALVIVYYGHNDFTNVYHHMFLGRASVDGMLRVTWRARNLLGMNTKGDFRYFRRSRIGPMLKPLQEWGLVRLDAGALRPVDNATLDVLEENTLQMIQAIEAAGVVGVLIPAVGNLHAEPYGPPEVTRLWEEGIALQPGPQQRKVLRRAADQEWLTPDIRLPQRGQQAIIALQTDQVLAFDLQRALDEVGFPYDGTVFSDWLHFTEEGHAAVAEAITNWALSTPRVTDAVVPSNGADRDIVAADRLGTP